MRKSLNLSIPTPCHEDWNQFTLAEKGRFCGSCQKVVVDFTSWSDEQIKNYFLNATGNTCGRFRTTQLASYPTIKINYSNWTASFLALLLLVISRPSLAQVMPRSVSNQEQLDQKTAAAQSDSIVTKMLVRGFVRDEENNSIPGANIVLKGTAHGAITDADGKFDLTIEKPKSSETLIISFIGFTSKEYVLAAVPTKELAVVMLYSDLELQGELVVGGVTATSRFSPRRLWWKVKSLFSR